MPLRVGEEVFTVVTAKETGQRHHHLEEEWSYQLVFTRRSLLHLGHAEGTGVVVQRSVWHRLQHDVGDAQVS